MLTLARKCLLLSVGVLIVVAWLGVNPAAAQDPNLKPSFGSVTLKADFQPDPYVKKLTAGGAIQTSLGGVKGYVDKAPDFKLFYQAGPYPLTIYVESTAATMLLINLPDGKWVIADGRMPLLEFAKPQSGRYDIWVGTIGKENAPAALKITELKIAEQKKRPGGQDEVERDWLRAWKLSSEGRYADAIALYEQIVPAAERVYGKDGRDTAKILNNLAENYRHAGQFPKAESIHQRSLRIRETTLGKDHSDVAESLNNLASVYSAMNNYAKAESLYQRGLQIREATLGKNHPEVGQSVNNLAILYWQMGQFTRAESLYERGLRIREATLGKDHRDVAHSLNNLGVLYNDMAQYAKAEPFHLRALQIREAKLGKDHPEVADSLNNLGVVYWNTRQHAKAESFYLRCLQIREAKLGKDHPEVAGALNNLGGLYVEMSQFAKAEPYFLRSLELRETAFGKYHPRVAQSHNNLAWNAANMQNWDKSIERFQTARQAAAIHAATTLSGLSEKEQLDMVQNSFEQLFHMALALGVSVPEEASAASAEWLLNGKALTHQVLAEQHILARDTRDPAARQLAQDLQAARARLAAVINGQPKAGLEKEYQQETEDLRAREQDLTQKLARKVGRPHRDNPWVTLAELRAKLGPKTAFVDIVRFNPHNYKTKKKLGPRYFAWITPPQGKGEVQLIDLGDAEAIDQLVEQTRKTLLDSAKTITKVGEVEATDALQKPLQELSARVLHPLLPTLEKYEEWIVCPDGALWLTPWSALLLPKGEFAVEKYLIRHVVSGRDLVLELPKGKANAAYLFADPDYDLSPGKVLTAAGGTRGSEDDPRSAGSAQSTLPKVPRLPGTAIEAEAVRPRLKQWLGQEPKMHLEAQASETLLKSIKNPRVLALATHGYFLPRQEVEAKGAKGLDNKGQPIENPLLRCGLLLAGCNRRAEAKAGEDDGILTGIEIVGLDLNGCELVVLSACETGLGDVRSGEGVAGLRQAFQLAGARGVLASLWQVPDRETALLMNGFYGELTKGRSQAEALRQSQLQRIASRRDQFGAAHPFFWSAFALTSSGTD